MPTPSTPSLTLTRLSSTSFRALITGDPGATHLLFYRLLDSQNDSPGGSRLGDGSLDISGLTDSAQLLAWALSSNGQLSLPRFEFLSLVTPDTLTGAIKSRWYSSVPLLSKAGKLYANEVPERDTDGAPLAVPYTYMDVSRTRFEWTVTNTYYAYTDIEFNIFAVGAQAAEEAQDELENTFNWKTLPFTSINTRTISFAPIDDQLTSENLRYKDGSLIYRAQTCYQVCLQKQLTNQPFPE